MALVGFLVFASALGASLAVLWLTLVPAMPRIMAILRDGPDAATPAIPVLIVSEARLRARTRTIPLVSRPQWRAAA